ncbi:MAG: NADH-quinone oxidoreductase subunit F, partial [Candidatus Aminicenantes bacterium]|nr:NADH-quinone oxidoreductase subunit F [Candidatus Aminicenantes bacterium]
MKTSKLIAACCSSCRHSRTTPCRHLTDCMAQGPICHASDDCRRLRAERLAQAKRGGEGLLIFIGTGTCGLANGSGKIMKQVESYLSARSIPAIIVEVGCVGYCQREVFVDLQPETGPRLSYCDLTPENIHEFLEEIFERKNLKNRFLLGRSREDGGAMPEVPFLQEVPFFRYQKKIVLENCGRIDPSSLDVALAAGAFRAAARALLEMAPSAVCDEVLSSGLRGRGGAGFLTGQKWRIAHDTVSAQKYLICNADEGDPGAFMDRAVLEGDPFRVLEGMIIAAYAIGASEGYIYCRA